MTQPDQPTNNNQAVVVDHLVKHFGDFTAVNDISFSVPKGEIFGFLGPNGAGKSTTIRMLCGILLPTAGTGMVNGFDILTQSERIKEHIGYMSQKFSLYEDLTVEENIEFYGDIYGVSTQRLKERKEWILKMANLKGREKSITEKLSVGWKQRLALGCALVHEPEILFLDEPTSGVDPVSRRSFWDLIFDVAGKGVTVFVTTHYMDEAEHCDRIGLIYRGQLIALGKPQQLKENFTSGLLVELHVQPVMQAMDFLETLPYVADVAIFGTALHLVITDESQLEQIKADMQKAELNVSDLSKVTPSLEDVFVSLIESADNDVQGGET